MNSFQQRLFVASCLLFLSSTSRVVDGFAPSILRSSSPQRKQHGGFLQQHNSKLGRNLHVRYAFLRNNTEAVGASETTRPGRSSLKKAAVRSSNPTIPSFKSKSYDKMRLTMSTSSSATAGAAENANKATTTIQQQHQQQQQPMLMGDLVDQLQVDEATSTTTSGGLDKSVLAVGAVAAALTVGYGLLSTMGIDLSHALNSAETFLQHPQETLTNVIDSISNMGPMGIFYFGLIYTIAEILAVPATPLTLSAGYLFGLTQGTAVVLVSATIAASVAFVVGKTLLRDWVEELLEEKPQFAKLDKAIGTQGFKLLFLVRLSPIFPFALSNYLYGASSIDFASYFFGTLLGFAPGTLAYVYTGMAGRALSTPGAEAQPWYVYAGGLVVLGGVLKLVSDVAGDIINAIDDDGEEGLSKDGVPSLPAVSVDNDESGGNMFDKMFASVFEKQ